MKSVSSGAVPSCSQSVAIDGRIGLGHAQLIAPDQHVEAGEPVELALACSRSTCVAHVGEDGGENAALLELELPGQHGGILRGPHARIPLVELFDGGRVGRCEAGVASELPPEREAGELSLVVSVPVGPVEASKRSAGRPVMRTSAACAVGVRRASEYHSIVEDHRAQSQCPSE